VAPAFRVSVMTFDAYDVMTAVDGAGMPQAVLPAFPPDIAVTKLVLDGVNGNAKVRASFAVNAVEVVKVMVAVPAEPTAELIFNDSEFALKFENVTVADPFGLPTLETGNSESAEALQCMVPRAGFTSARSSPDGLFKVRRFAYRPMLLAENMPSRIALVKPDAVFQVDITVGFKPKGHAACEDALQSRNTTGPSVSDMLESM